MELHLDDKKTTSTHVSDVSDKKLSGTKSFILTELMDTIEDKAKFKI